MLKISRIARHTVKGYSMAPTSRMFAKCDNDYC